MCICIAAVVHFARSIDRSFPPHRREITCLPMQPIQSPPLSRPVVISYRLFIASSQRESPAFATSYLATQRWRLQVRASCTRGYLMHSHESLCSVVRAPWNGAMCTCDYHVGLFGIGQIEGWREMFPYLFRLSSMSQWQPAFTTFTRGKRPTATCKHANCVTALSLPRVCAQPAYKFIGIHRSKMVKLYSHLPWIGSVKSDSVTKSPTVNNVSMHD